MFYSNTDDPRDEWYGMRNPPRIYWLGMAVSAIWLAGYMLIYPSIPFLHTHWLGWGFSGGCQPWTAICQMQQSEEKLRNPRRKYLERIEVGTASELARDIELRDFALRAGRVPFADHCAGCHRPIGRISGKEAIATALNDTVWSYGGSLSDIQRSICSKEIHPFGLPARLSTLDGKVLALYVYASASASEQGR